MRTTIYAVVNAGASAQLLLSNYAAKFEKCARLTKHLRIVCKSAATERILGVVTPRTLSLKRIEEILEKEKRDNYKVLEAKQAHFEAITL